MMSAIFSPYFAVASSRFYWLYLCSALLLTCCYGLYFKKPWRFSSLYQYWFHPSAWLDYQFFIISALLRFYLLLPILISADSVAFYVHQYLIDYLGYREPLYWSRTQIAICYTFVLFIASDFSRYLLHFALHYFDVLWAFHKVHHSATVLNPVTFYRVHPVENLLFGLRYSLVVGVVTAVFLYWFAARLSLVTIFGANVLIFCFNTFAGNLRHSHIPLAYPRWLESILMSPRQHQLHHVYRYSRYNYGGYLAIWDSLFHTLKKSEKTVVHHYGIGKESVYYQSLSALFFKPFVEVFMLIQQKRKLKIACFILLCCLPLFYLRAEEVVKKPIDASDKRYADKVMLGTALFFDTNLSKNRTQSCATCHDPARAFTDGRDNGVAAAVSLGDDGKSLGDRNAPTAAYAMFFPLFQKNTGKNQKLSAFLGGQFLDGREPDLAGQAGGPPLNPVEMGMPDKASVVARLQENAAYVTQFKAIYGEHIFDDHEKAYAAMTDAIATFEQTEFFAPFDSKYDRFLRGEYQLTALEDLGRSLFFSNNNTNCATCHTRYAEDDPRETFTNFEYRNIGVPVNQLVRQKNGAPIDLGLFQNAKAAGDKANRGLFKVPTLRNVAVTPPYMHNGVFQDLETVILFYDQYNNPDHKINPETGKPWGAPEVAETISHEELKAKALNDRKVAALVAFLKTLTDARYEPLLAEMEKTAQAKKAVKSEEKVEEKSEAKSEEKTETKSEEKTETKS